MDMGRQLAHSQDISTKVSILFQKRVKTAQERFTEQLRNAYEDHGVAGMLANPASAANLWSDWPAPQVFQTSLDDFYVQYRLVCQASPLDARMRAEVVSALNASIQDVFNEYGVQIMSPHYLGDPAEAKVVPRSRWFAPPAKGG